LQLTGYADDINIIGINNGAVPEVHEELKERAKEAGLNIRAEKTKTQATVQNRRTRIISEILAIKDHDIEVVRSFKYLGTVISNTNEEAEEIKVRILAANRVHSSLPTPWRSKQVHRNNQIRLHTTKIKPVLCYGSVTRP
jgi:hypothetical protein